MPKESEVIINLIEAQKDKARTLNSLENTFELAFLLALCEVNSVNPNAEVSAYISNLTKLRSYETDLRISQRLEELEILQNERL